MIRNITGSGEGKGPYIAIHDGFAGAAAWAGFLPQSDRVMMDVHVYLAFDNQPHNDPIDTGLGPSAGGIWPRTACEAWTPLLDAR